MIIRKRFLVLLLSTSVLVGCNQGDSSVTSNPDNAIQISEKKHEAVNLPVDIFVDSSYKIEGEQVGFTRSITDVEIKDFDDSSEIEFLERYGNAASQGFDLQKDFKMLVISMKHEVHKEALSRPLESYSLNAGSGLVIGDIDLLSRNELLKYAQDYISTGYMPGGSTFDETGNILLPVPNEFVNDKYLQLKITQKLDNKNNYIYIDL